MKLKTSTKDAVVVLGGFALLAVAPVALRGTTSWNARGVNGGEMVRRSHASRTQVCQILWGDDDLKTAPRGA